MVATCRVAEVTAPQHESQEPNRFIRALSKTFLSLSVRNFRLYFYGQIVSISGTWMQTVAQSLLILSKQIHGNGVDVGVATALQYVPMLFFASFGGLVADRFSKRHILIATQVAAGLLALALGLLTLEKAVTLNEVFIISAGLGVVNLFDNPSRQTFVPEMVGHELVPNAVSLNSVLVNAARIVGPAIGGVLIFTVGFPACFLANAGSYVAVLIALWAMRPHELHPTPKVARSKGQVREGLRYIARTPRIRGPLLLMALLGTLAYNFTTTLPLLARFTFHGDAGTYTRLTVAMGVGAVIGGLSVAHRSRPSRRNIGVIGVAFGLMMGVVALSPNEEVALGALVVMGIFSIAFLASCNSYIQLHAEPSMRGRVMAIYATAFLGTTPIGAPLMGWICDISSPRVALGVGGGSAFLASIALLAAISRD
jgi:MFS family permease